MNTFAERLSLLIETVKSNKNKFAASIGTSSALISKLTTQDVDYRAEILVKIAEKYPSVNIHWLLTGVGEMMYANSSEKDNGNPRGNPRGQKKDIDNQSLTQSGISDLNNSIKTAISMAEYHVKDTLYFLIHITPKHKSFERIERNLDEIPQLMNELKGEEIKFGKPLYETFTVEKKVKVLNDLNTYLEGALNLIREITRDAFMQSVKDDKG